MTERSLRSARPIERAVGIEHYVSDVDGIGGRLRAAPEDFRVREIERFEAEPVDADPGDYPHLLLRVTLREWDTNAFARSLSNRLGIGRERVDWAGTKDKYAVTTQLFSVYGVDPDELPVVRDTDIEVVGRTGRGIEFGDLAGNEFEVTVSDPDRPEHVGPITDALAAFVAGEAPSAATRSDEEGAPVTVGVPNYFGQQRFGSRRPITHEVGLAIVRGDWEGAVRAYVADDHEHEPDGTREARQAAAACFEDRDWRGALDVLPERLDFERSLLHHLDAGSGDPDFRGALETFPENLQRMLVNAAQSFVFNRICSERLERGLPFARPVEGDVACFVDGDAPGAVVVPDTDRTQRVTQRRVDTMARHCQRGRAFVTAPLIGTDTELADGEPGEIERTVLDDLDLDPADFDLPGEWASSGTRRALLVRTDLDIDDGNDPTFRFALPKGSYATVLLREYLKVDPVDLG